MLGAEGESWDLCVSESSGLGFVFIYFETHFKVVGVCSSNLQLNLIWEQFGRAGSSMPQAALLQFI